MAKRIDAYNNVPLMIRLPIKACSQVAARSPVVPRISSLCNNGRRKISTHTHISIFYEDSRESAHLGIKKFSNFPTLESLEAENRVKISKIPKSSNASQLFSPSHFLFFPLSLSLLFSYSFHFKLSHLYLSYSLGFLPYLRKDTRFARRHSSISIENDSLLCMSLRGY